jgi:hypothetical protein
LTAITTTLLTTTTSATSLHCLDHSKELLCHWQKLAEHAKPEIGKKSFVGCCFDSIIVQQSFISKYFTC